MTQQGSEATRSSFVGMPGEGGKAAAVAPRARRPASRGYAAVTDDGLMSESGRTPTAGIEASEDAREVSLAGARVVVCEDEGVTLLQLRRALIREGMQVVGTTTNGRDGVAAVLRERPDLVLMDIRMPIMDGIEAARIIMELSPVCVVMLTAFPNDEYRAQAAAVGASGYVVKPVAGETLMPSLRRALAGFRSRGC